MVEFKYAPMFQLGEDTTEYYRLTDKYVSLGNFEGHDILKVEPEALTMLANAAFRDVNFLLRPAHNEQVAKILNDPEASSNAMLRLLRRGSSRSARILVLPLSMVRKASRSGLVSMMQRLFPRVSSRLTQKRISATARMLL